MTDEVAAAGDLVSGALVARAVEGGTGAGRPMGDHAAACLNCGTRLIGSHCHRCGQSGHVHRSVGAIGHELAHGVFHFEGKIFRTLPLLIFRPGALTRRYIAGERARFVSPLALFLFTVFAMFAIYSWVGASDFTKGVADGLTEAQSGFDQSRARIERRVVALEERRRSAAGAETTAIDRELAEARAEIVKLDRFKNTVAARQTPDPTDATPGWFKRNFDYARANPALVAYKVQSSAYKYSWVLIPLSVPLVALLFLWRRGFNLYDHAIFVTYSIGFMSLLVIVLEIWLTLDLPEVGFYLLLFVVPPVHMFAQLRGAYSLSRFSAAWRTVALYFFAFWTLVLFVISLFAIGVSH